MHEHCGNTQSHDAVAHINVAPVTCILSFYKGVIIVEIFWKQLCSLTGDLCGIIGNLAG